MLKVLKNKRGGWNWNAIIAIGTLVGCIPTAWAIGKGAAAPWASAPQRQMEDERRMGRMEQRQAVTEEDVHDIKENVKRIAEALDVTYTARIVTNNFHLASKLEDRNGP